MNDEYYALHSTFIQELTQVRPLLHDAISFLEQVRRKGTWHNFVVIVLSGAIYAKTGNSLELTIALFRTKQEEETQN